MGKFVEKWLHNLTASPKRGFGIHSPFVFRFQQEIVNAKGNEEDTNYNGANYKILRMLLRMHSFYSLKSPLLLSGTYREGFEQLRIPYSTLPIKRNGYDLVVLDSTDFFDENYLKQEAFVILTGNHEKMHSHPLKYRCNVFLDFYSAAVCVFNKGLSAQSFKMKL